MIFSLLSLPMDGFRFVLNTIIKVAEEQYTDDAPLKEELLNLQVKLENGEITEDEYVETEAQILRELREIQHRKMELAGVDPEEYERPFTGNVGEGSGVSLNFQPAAEESEEQE
jgi:hypothetical protein